MSTSAKDVPKYKITKLGGVYVARTMMPGERTYHEASTSRDREKLKRIYEDAGFTYMK